MKKHNVRRSLVALLLICLLFASCTTPKSACRIGHHAWIDATCQSAKRCTVCGASEGTPLAHNWQDATCDANKICADCGLCDGLPVGHREDAMLIVVPTCTDVGKLLYRCRECNAEHTAEVAATGHTEGPGYCLTCGVAVENKIKNVIYIIGDGMGLEHIAAGQLAYGTHYDFTDWQRATVNTDSLDYYGKASQLTDSAAAGTALATGTLTANGRVGLGAGSSTPLSTILDYAKGLGKKTGILTTDALHGATPGAFSAHVADRDDATQIVNGQLSSNVDLLAGTYDSICVSKLKEIRESGYTYAEGLDYAYKSMDADKLYVQLPLEGNTTGSRAVSLADAAMMAIEYLDNEEGFVLMIEQAHIDKFSHSNQFSQMVAMVDSLNKTVEAVWSWAKDRTDTLIVVTSDHETGGLSVGRESRLPSIYRGSNGKVYYCFESTDHTDSDVGLFIWGTSFDFSTLPYMQSSQEVKNCDIPKMIKKILAR